MSKLEKVIKKLENLSFPFENSDWAIIEDCTESLIELNKPAQYVVKYGYENRFVDIMFYRLNGICICVHETYHPEAAIYCHKMINDSAILLGLSLITMDQLTFVKTEIWKQTK